MRIKRTLKACGAFLCIFYLSDAVVAGAEGGDPKITEIEVLNANTTVAGRPASFAVPGLSQDVARAALPIMERKNARLTAVTNFSPRLQVTPPFIKGLENREVLAREPTAAPAANITEITPALEGASGLGESLENGKNPDAPNQDPTLQKFYDVNHNAAPLDGEHIVLIPSYFYGGANGATAYTRDWMQGLLRRNGACIHIIHHNGQSGEEKESVKLAGRGMIHNIPVQPPERDPITRERDWVGAFVKPLQDAIRRFSPSLIITHTPRPDIVELIADVAQAGRISSMILFNIPIEPSDERIRVYSKLTLRAAVSRYVADIIPDGKTEILSPVIDFDFWNPKAPGLKGVRDALRRQYGLEGKFVLLLPHRIAYENEKGQKDALEALALLSRSKKTEHCVLVMLGTPDESDYAAGLKEYIQSHGLERDVVWLPSQNPASLREWYAAADLTLAPTHKEALGLVAIESQAMGKPVVAYRVGGVPETINERRTGLMVPEGDVDQFARSIARLASDQSLYESMVRQTRPFIRSRFDPDRVLQQHEDVLSRLAHPRP